MAEIHYVSRVDLAIDPVHLPWEAENAEAIAANWDRAVADRPTMFDGLIYVATDLQSGPDRFAATARPMRFAALTWWRALGMPPSGFHSMFGDIVLRGADGGLLMARTATHTATGGMLGFPGGTFDANDVDGDRLDPMTCILRECAEETGWQASDLRTDDRFLVHVDRVRVAVTLIAEMGLPADEGARRTRAALAAQDQPELSEIWVVRGPDDMDRIAPHPYSRALADWIFAHA